MNSIFYQFDKGVDKDTFYLSSSQDKKCKGFNELMKLVMTSDYEDHTESIKELVIKYPGMMEDKNTLGYNALMLAVMNVENVSSEKIVTLLLDLGCNINARSTNGLTALMLAAFHKTSNSNTLNILLDYGANINAVDNFGNTALHHAIKHKRYANTFILLEYGALTNISNINGYTVMHFAATSNTDILKMVIQQSDINVNITSNNGKTPLFLACENVKYKNIQTLLNNNDVLINVQDNDGNTPLLSMISGNKITRVHQKIIKLLLSKGANPNIKNKLGYGFYDKINVGTIMDFTNNNINLNISVDIIKDIMLKNKDSINNEQLDFLINYRLNNL